MSWSFGVTGANAAEVMERLTTAANNDPHCPIPATVVQAAEVLMGAFADDIVTGAASYGHVNEGGFGSNASITISTRSQQL